MLCPLCQSDTKIYNSRQTDEGLITWRRHRCTNCQAKFTSRERIDWGSLIKVVRSDGHRAPYQREILLDSLSLAFQHKTPAHGVITSLGDAVEAECTRDQAFNTSEVSTATLAKTIMRVLARFDREAALAYALRYYDGQPPQEVLVALMRN